MTPYSKRLLKKYPDPGKMPEWALSVLAESFLASTTYSMCRKHKRHLGEFITFDLDT